MSTAAWYENLQKPFFAPPSYVFGLVWSILYPIIFLSFGYIGLLVYRGSLPRIVLIPLILNLISNLAFSPIQFGLQNNLLALADIFVVLLSLVWLVLLLSRESQTLALIQLPYLLWVLFATILQLSITLLNWP